MKTFIVRLFFRNSLHAGAASSGIGIETTQDFIHSDTIWAALANHWALIGMVNGIDFETFLASYRSAKPFFLVSSAFPVSEDGNQYWLPKPLAGLYGFSRSNPLRLINMLDYNKDLKNIRFLPLDVFKEWARFEDFDLSRLKGDQTHIINSVRPQSACDRVSMNSNLYHSGLSYFDYRLNHGRSGLYFLVKTNDEVSCEVKIAIEELMKAIFDTAGFGGNIHTGNGQLAEMPTVIDISEDDNDTTWAEVLTEDFEGANARCLLSLCHPLLTEIEEGFAAEGFTHILRKGWTGSLTTDAQVKRRTTAMFGEGSVFITPLTGGLADVTPNSDSSPQWRGQHNVYRYGYAFSVPMKIDKSD